MKRPMDSKTLMVVDAKALSDWLVSLEEDGVIPPAQAWRFSRRRRGENCWEVYLAMTALMPEKLAKAYCQRHSNHAYEWRYDECLPTDYDYPGREHGYISRPTV